MNPVIAVDLGATNIRVAKISGDGKIVAGVSALTPRNPRSPAEITDIITRMIGEVSHAGSPCDVEGIGICAAGPVRSREGAVINPPNIALPVIPLAKPVSNEFGIPVRVINDCPAGALGELYFGQGKGCRDYVYVTISTGIGGGVIAGGRVLLGMKGNAAEIGHFHVDSRYNLTCGCGCTGHWEAYASGRFLPSFFSAWCTENIQDMPGAAAVSPEDIFALIRKEPIRFQGFIEEFCRINAQGLSNLIVAYDPARIILDGSVIRHNADLVLPDIIRNIDRFLPLPVLTLSGLDGSAPLLGASVIARGYDTAAGSLLPG